MLVFLEAEPFSTKYIYIQYIYINNNTFIVNTGVSLESIDCKENRLKVKILNSMMNNRLYWNTVMISVDFKRSYVSVC